MASQNTPQPARLIRRTEVEARTGLCRSSIYDKLSTSSKYFDPAFPRPVGIGGRAVAWVESEIDDWITERIATRGLPTQASLAGSSAVIWIACRQPPKTNAATPASHYKDECCEIIRNSADLETGQRRPLRRNGSRA